MNDLPRGFGAAQGLSMDTLFIDVPVSRPIPGAAPLDRIRMRLTELDAAWFCEAGDGACLDEVRAGIAAGTFGLLSRLIPVGTAGAGEAPERFLRLTFARPMQPDQVGSVVNAVRTWVGESGMPATVGREAAAVVLSGPARADAATRAYALARVGLEALPPGRSVNARVDVALLDTGIDPRVAAALGTQSVELPGGDLAGDLHPHGTHMALLLRQMTERAQIHDVRVLGTNGVGPVGDVARGLISSISLGNPNRPLVINLSLGWPPELGQPRLMRDANGTVVGREDPVGESVRYALLLARERGALVVAAAGNRPTRAAAARAVYDRWFDVSDMPPATGCAGVPAPAGPRHFFPAEWSRVVTCAPGGQPASLAWTVGALGEGDAPAALAIDGREHALWLPGEHVYLEVPQVPVSTPEFECGVGERAGLSSPTVVSGTSVSAALASGLVARLVARDEAVDANASAAAAALLLELSARPGAPGPRVDGCRAEAAMTCRPAPCLAADGGVPTDPAVRQACAAALAACRPLDACRVPAPAPRNLDALGFRPEEACACQHAPDTVAPEAACAGVDTVCPYEQTLDAHSLGFAGPQPIQPTCPDCIAYVGVATAKVDLALALDEALTEATAFQSAWLVVKSPAGTTWKALSDTTSLNQWLAGQAIYIAGIGIPATHATACQTWCIATLEGVVTTPANTTTSLTAALFEKVQ